MFKETVVEVTYKSYIIQVSILKLNNVSTVVVLQATTYTGTAC